MFGLAILIIIAEVIQVWGVAHKKTPFVREQGRGPQQTICIDHAGVITSVLVGIFKPANSRQTFVSILTVAPHFTNIHPAFCVPFDCHRTCNQRLTRDELDLETLSCCKTFQRRLCASWRDSRQFTREVFFPRSKSGAKAKKRHAEVLQTTQTEGLGKGLTHCLLSSRSRVRIPFIKTASQLLSTFDARALVS